MITFSHSYGPYTTFTSGLGSNFIEYTGSGIYHNKYMIVDPSDKCSDPIVLTGSHNWSLAADDDNDENTLIIHDDTVANIYYQSFRQNFISLSGSLTLLPGCTLGLPDTKYAVNAPIIYPNPSNGEINISYTLPSSQNVSIIIYNSLGQKAHTPVSNELQDAGIHSYMYSLPKGFYLFYFTTGTHNYTKSISIVD
jgi:hypothetical protein